VNKDRCEGKWGHGYECWQQSFFWETKHFEEELDADFEKCFEWRKFIQRASGSKEYTRQRARYSIRAKHDTNPRSDMIRMWGTTTNHIHTSKGKNLDLIYAVKLEENNRERTRITKDGGPSSNQTYPSSAMCSIYDDSGKKMSRSGVERLQWPLSSSEAVKRSLGSSSRRSATARVMQLELRQYFPKEEGLMQHIYGRYLPQWWEQGYRTSRRLASSHKYLHKHKELAPNAMKGL